MHVGCRDFTTHTCHTCVNRYNQDQMGKALWTANFVLRLGLNKLLPWLVSPPAFMMVQVRETGEAGKRMGKGERGGESRCISCQGREVEAAGYGKSMDGRRRG